MSSGLNVDAKIQNEQSQQQQNAKINSDMQTDSNNNNNNNNKASYQQQQQQDEVDYKIDKMMPKQNQKQKLIQQNIKLKTQIYELALQLDEILQRDKLKKKKYGINANTATEEEDEAIKGKKLELKRQELQIVEVKNKIFQLKRQLDSVFNNQIVQQQEDKLKHIKRKLQQLANQKNGLIKIKKGQQKAIKTIKNEEQFKQKIQKTHKQVMRIKQETQKMMEKALQARKDEVNSHERYVLKTQKIRQLQNKLATNAKGMKQKQKTTKTLPGSNTSSKDTISNQLIAELEQEIKKLQIQKRQGEKVWQDKIRLIQNQLQIKRAEQQRKLLILREKEKQLKLNEIRIRELRKLIKQNIIQENTKKSEDMDMSQFRHRRNIRYMEK